MEMLLSVLRPVMSYVSDEALEDALSIAGQATAARSVRAAAKPQAAAPDVAAPKLVGNSSAEEPGSDQGRLL